MPIIDRDKIIKGLECCKASMDDDDPFVKCHECPYNDVCLYVDGCRSVLCKDALELLKAQESIKPKNIGGGEWVCEDCDVVVGEDVLQSWGIDKYRYTYCPSCGRKVKWNVR